MARLGRILVAGDGTLLVADQELTEPRPVTELLDAGEPLLVAALRSLDGQASGGAGGDSVDDPSSTLLVRQVHAPGGTLVAVEVSDPEHPGPPLQLGGWQYPCDPEPAGWGPELAALHGTGAHPAAIAALLLPDVPLFLSGLRELFAQRHALRDLRLAQRDVDRIRTVRMYGWLPESEPADRAVGVTVDVTAMTGRGEESARFFEAITAVAPDAVLVLDVLHEELLWSNGRLAEQLGYRPEQLLRYADFRRAVHWGDREELDRVVSELDADPARSLGDLRFRMRDADGRWRWMHIWLTAWQNSASDGAVDGRGRAPVEQVVCTVRDVDESVRAEQRLQWEARHDPLTGLANRRVIQEMLSQVAADPRDTRRHVYFLDVDDFKKVNDALGHSAGDELLRTLAARITVLVRPADVVARFGGDELIIVSALDPAALAGRLLAAVRGRTLIAGSELTVSASVGVAVVDAGELPGDVIRRANDAMYQAKRAGRDRYEIAGPLDTGPAQQRVELEASLRRAVTHDSPEIDMAFQPIVDRDLKPVAAEALLRWRHPTRGPLLPAEFLPVAEAAGLMTELGELILRKSVAAAAGWAASGHPLTVSVNVGGRQLGNGRLERVLIPLLAEYQVPASLLCLEVTESVLVDADSPELTELFGLRELGLAIALDDFGTGYSPLTYLKRLPATVLKLDRSFVTGLGLPVPDPVDVAIARSVLELSTEIGLRVVAEGVESREQLELLAGLGYRYFQGFWAHPPMSADEVGALLSTTEPLDQPVE